MEGSESFTVAISSPGSTTGAPVTGTGSVSTTIADNDTATWSLTGSSSATETTNASYTISLAGTLQNGETATTAVALTNVTTTSGDHGALTAAITAAIGARTDLSFNGTTLTYTGDGSAMTALTFALAATDDTLVEGDEGFTVGISSPGSTTGAPVTGTGSVSTTITDNDAATWSLTGSSSATEGTNASYTISLAGTLQSGETATTGLALTDGTTTSADRSALTARITAAIGARTDLSFNGTTLTSTGNGSAMTALTFTIATTNDTLVEGSESFTVAMASPGSTTGAPVTGTGSVSTTITDNDTASLAIQTTRTVTEQGGEQTVTVTLTTSDGAGGTATLAPGVTLTAEVIDANGGDAISGTDYTAFDSQTVSFGASSSNLATRTVTFTTINDQLVEGSETANLTLQNLNSTLNGQASLGNTGSVVTITDNDTATVAISAPAATAAEGGGTSAALLTLTLATDGTGPAQLANAVTVNLSDLTTGTATAGTDYTFTAPTPVTFAAGSATGATRTASFASINNDLFVEGTETVNLSAAIGSGPATISGGNTLTREIADNDTASIGFATTASSISENAGRHPIEVVLTITSDGDGDGTPTLEREVTFQLTTVAGGTATGGGVDYTLPAAITFNAGSLDHATKTADLSITNESRYEDDETVVLGLSIESDGTGGRVSVATGSAANHTTTITNDDAVPAISIGDASVTEGNFGTANAVFTVSLSNPSVQTVTVNYATANGIAIAPGDYASLTGQLSFAPGETMKTVDVAVRGEALYEQGQNETFFVHLTTPGNGTLGDAQATGTITNDDTAPTNLFVISKTQSFTFFDFNHDQVVVKLTGNGTGTVALVGDAADAADISEIRLSGTDLTSALAVTVKKDAVTGDGVVGIGEVTTNRALKSFTAKAADFTVAGLTAAGAVKLITVRNLLSGEIITGGAATDKLALTLGAVSAGTLIDTPETISTLKALDLGNATVRAAAFGSITVTGGSLAANLTSAGAIATITVKGGGLSGHLTARSFGAVSIAGGDFSGSLTSLTPAATLGKIAALKSLTVADGDLTGDVRLLGMSGSITVKAKKTGPGGNLAGASIVASKIEALTVARDFTNSIVLAGADLGADFAFGGAADTFATGTIRAVRIGGAASGAGSIIGAGFSTTNTTLKDSDDAILGGVASVIASLTITGTADPNSYFAAGLFKAVPKIGGVAVILATDARFKVA